MGGADTRPDSTAAGQCGGGPDTCPGAQQGLIEWQLSLHCVSFQQLSPTHVQAEEIYVLSHGEDSFRAGEHLMEKVFVCMYTSLARVEVVINLMDLYPMQMLLSYRRSKVHRFRSILSCLTASRPLLWQSTKNLPLPPMDGASLSNVVYTYLCTHSNE